MHARVLAVSFCAVLVGSVAMADPRSVQLAATSQMTSPENTRPSSEEYRGYIVDLSEVANRPDIQQLADGLKLQIGIVEGVGLSDRTLAFFRSVPIMVDEQACLPGTEENPTRRAAACFTTDLPVGRHFTTHGTVWDSNKGEWKNDDLVALASDSGVGLVAVRPGAASSGRLQHRDPLLLHEFLHAYHHNVLPKREKNPAIIAFFEKAKGQYPKDAYLLTNEKEFFAVTGSVFLYGIDHDSAFPDHKFTRTALKKAQPEYYSYLVWLFGFDPEHSPSSGPVASAQ
jgi:hypothetical protein